MLMVKALRERPIARLWLGQALSSIGDEIYRVGLTWMLVGIIGANTGYLNAGQAAALMILSFVGGRWADHWEPLVTMVRVDFIRAGIVLIPVIYSHFATVPLPLYVIVALSLSGLGAFFDPSLQAALPRFSRDLNILRAATGLMTTTTRLARLVGPAIVGVMATVVDPIHFFTVDALSFLISALSVRALFRMPAPHTHAVKRKPVRQPLREVIVSGFRAIRQHPGMNYIVLSKAVTGGTWSLIYGLGLALLVQKVAPHDARAFGSVMAAYGLGNFAGALYFGNRERPRPGLMMFIGYVWMGLGFMLVACAPTIGWMIPLVAISGFAGTMNEVTFSDLVQARFDYYEIPRIFRLRMACDTLSILICTLGAPLLLQFVSVRVLIALGGLVWVNAGFIGIFWHNKSLELPLRPHPGIRSADVRPPDPARPPPPEATA